ncbi:cytidylyltransferase domain-containing protein, partial [Candidatus Omnitrophota bacterium]
SIFARIFKVFYLSLNKGLKFNMTTKRHKVMREATWGLYKMGGYYFHDDFLVDGEKIKKEDLLLFSRGVPETIGRLEAYDDAQKSPYRHFNLLSLSMGIVPFFTRVIPKYIISSSLLLFKEITSPFFSLYWSLHSYLIYNALPYEKLFSHFRITSELGHSHYSAGHVVESIVCQNYSTKYYLMHWSDHSLALIQYVFSFLGCDDFLSWGMAHINTLGVDAEPYVLTGYPFKRFIKEVASNRDKVLKDMGIRAKGKIISFFDESFGGDCKMTKEHYLSFWKTALGLAELEKDNTVLIKQKSAKYKRLSPEMKKEFFAIKDKIHNMPNAYIIDHGRWSFIESIGVSDIVVTQGMTSSATIAIICGIEGLYLDEAGYKHAFAVSFKDKLVFDRPEGLISMVQKIIAGTESPLKSIPETMLRDLDAYSDDRGIDLFRSILSGDRQKSVGIIIQARMGSTRLPGKVMKSILGKPMLQILIERLRHLDKNKTLIIATTRNKNDDVIEKLANELGVFCYRGDEEDVLDRYYQAARMYGLDVIVRITADCPFSDPALIDGLIEHYFRNPQADYAANVLTRTYPRGFDIEVFSFEALEKAAKEARKRYQREHVTPFIVENSRLVNYSNNNDASMYRVTVDTAEDFELVSFIFEELKDRSFGYRDVVTLLDSRPDLVKINQHIEQKKVEAV